MPTLFNSLRACLLAATIAFSLVCLAMAGQFSQKLAVSELTRFVPFAIFVGVAGLIIGLVLLGASVVLGARNPISTRIELACLAFAALLWFILGIFLSVSEAGEADVECYDTEEAMEASSNFAVREVLDESVASFQTEQYQAMYRVLTAFSLLNAVLLLLAFFALLALALRRHRAGDTHMWHAPVTHCAWFNSYKDQDPPLTTKPERKRTNTMREVPTVLPIAAAHTSTRRQQPARQNTSRSNRSLPPTPAAERHASTRTTPNNSTNSRNNSRSNTKSSGVRQNRDYGSYGSQGRRPKDLARVYPSASRHGRLASGSDTPLMGSNLIDGINDGELLDDNPRLERGRR